MACDVFIFGSCVSRDIFNFDSAGRFNIVDYHARQSLGALIGQPYRNDVALQRISSDFRRRMVMRDFTKSILQASNEIARADIILLDLIDERFDLVLLPTGHVLTHSAELAESKLLSEPEAKGYKPLKPGSKERREYWLEGAEKFFSWLQANGKRKAVLVNKVYWSSHITSGGQSQFAVSQGAIAKANAELDWMYTQLQRWVSADQFMSFASDVLIADADHRWGVAPFHYVSDYYRAAAEQIMQRHEVLNRCADQSSLTEVEQLRSTARDIRPWGRATLSFDSVDEFVMRGAEDGLCQMRVGQDQFLDILLQNFGTLGAAGARKILVVLSGAVPQRSGKMAPFFSGVGIAKALELPLIAISDPSLALDADLSLGWYAGNESLPDLPFLLADILDSYASRFEAELLIIGGSGGGFAALQLGALLQSAAQLVVWNPQTSIADYSRSHVVQYLRCAFPRLQIEPKEGDLYQSLQSAGIRHDLKSYPLRSNVHVLYLQNQTDWHIEKHTGPYLAAGEYLQVDHCCWQEKNTRCIVSVGLWGDGHLAPPKDLLLNVLRKVSAGVPLLEVAQCLARDPNFRAPEVISRFSLARKTEFKVSATLAQSSLVVTAHLLVDGEKATSVMYAFYLLVDGKRFDVRWYSESKEVVFSRPTELGALEVVGFAKDIFGEKLIVKVAVD